MVSTSQSLPSKVGKEDTPKQLHLGFGERAFSAAFLSAILVNPLDVAKTRLQAQVAEVPHQTNTMLPEFRYSPPDRHAVLGAGSRFPPERLWYNRTMDVYYKVIREEGFARLWRGTNASLASAVPTVGIYMPCYDIIRNSMEDFTTKNTPNFIPYVPLVASALSRSLACVICYPVELARTHMQAFKVTQSGVKPPGVWKTLHGVINPLSSTNNLQNKNWIAMNYEDFEEQVFSGILNIPEFQEKPYQVQEVQSYRTLWTGIGAQLARDVPFSAIYWSILEPIRRGILVLVGDEASVGRVVGANFTAGFIAGSLAAAATCPLDVARTRMQIEKDPTRALKMTTRQTLVEIWRDGGVKRLFTGLGPRVSRAGPSVGIVVSFYETMKYTLYQKTQL